ncbi:hypothetical protein VMCG_03062 [Cytospora schulzeri]|uniref:Uncharacterized protein n=1 Tax=Cytospora schulzeri TaxID=448051 RepID=A0A423WYG7_9PEZI|nr:hypothetical protein VMCG_03062 [Valsa malicola]
MASEYDPADTTVKCMDVFVVDPSTAVAKDRKDWVDNKLSHWKNQQGAHYIGAEIPRYLKLPYTL